MNKISNLWNIYCDESCHLENDNKQYMILGYISIPCNKIKRVKYDIKCLRKKHKNSLEVKWSNLTEWNYIFYSELIGYFFDHSYISFRSIIVDKKKYIADKCDDDYDKFYYKMYYQLIYHKLDVSNGYNIFIDIKDTLSSHRIRTLRNILNIQMGVINNIQHIRSHEVDLLQICDLIIGATSYKMNEPSGSSIPKLKLIAKIEDNLRGKLDEQTPPYEEKFNVFRIKL